MLQMGTLRPTAWGVWYLCRPLQPQVYLGIPREGLDWDLSAQRGLEST